MRKLLLFFFISFTLLLYSCSSIQLAYNQSDFLLKWWLGSYIDSTASQKAFLDQAAPKLLNTHRINELPQVQAKLIKLRSLFDRPIRYEEAKSITVESRAVFESSIFILLDDAATLALLLNPNQLSNIEKAFKKANSQYQSDYLTPSSQVSFEKRFDKLVERTEFFTGDLSKAQKIQLQIIAAQFLLDNTTIYQNRLRKQADILSTLNLIIQTKPSHPATKEMLKTLFLGLINGRTADQKDYEQLRIENSTMVLLKITELLNDQQLKKIQSKIKSLEGDVSLLIGS